MVSGMAIPISRHNHPTPPFVGVFVAALTLRSVERAHSYHENLGQGRACRAANLACKQSAREQLRILLDFHQTSQRRRHDIVDIGSVDPGRPAAARHCLRRVTTDAVIVTVVPCGPLVFWTVALS